MSREYEVKVMVGSRIEYVDTLHAMAEEMAKLAGFDDSGRFNFALAVREAAINAMMHGNGRDPEKQVTITFQMADHSLSASVLDQGPGFDFSARRSTDPRAPENRFKPSGRGLLLIREFVDEVTYNHENAKGTEIRLVKHLPGHDPGAAGQSGGN